MWEQAVFGANHRNSHSSFPAVNSHSSKFIWLCGRILILKDLNCKIFKFRPKNFVLFPISYSTLSFHSRRKFLPGVYTKFSTSIRSPSCSWLHFIKTSTHWKNLDFLSPSSGTKANRKPWGHFIPWDKNSSFLDSFGCCQEEGKAGWDSSRKLWNFIQSLQAGSASPNPCIPCQHREDGIFQGPLK